MTATSVLYFFIYYHLFGKRLDKDFVRKDGGKDAIS